MQMDTSRLSRSPAAMRPLPWTRSASDAMTPTKPGFSSLGERHLACLRLPSPASSAAASSQPLASRSGGRQGPRRATVAHTCSATAHRSRYDAAARPTRPAPRPRDSGNPHFLLQLVEERPKSCAGALGSRCGKRMPWSSLPCWSPNPDPNGAHVGPLSSCFTFSVWVDSTCWTAALKLVEWAVQTLYNFTYETSANLWS